MLGRHWRKKIFIFYRMKTGQGTSAKTRVQKSGIIPHDHQELPFFGPFVLLFWHSRFGAWDKPEKRGSLKSNDYYAARAHEPYPDPFGYGTGQ